MQFLRHKTWLNLQANHIQNDLDKQTQALEMHIKNAACLTLPNEIKHLIHQFSHLNEHHESKSNGTTNMQ